MNPISSVRRLLKRGTLDDGKKRERDRETAYQQNAQAVECATVDMLQRLQGGHGGAAVAHTGARGVTHHVGGQVTGQLPTVTLGLGGGFFF